MKLKSWEKLAIEERLLSLKYRIEKQKDQTDIDLLDIKERDILIQRLKIHNNIVGLRSAALSKLVMTKEDYRERERLWREDSKVNCGSCGQQTYRDEINSYRGKFYCKNCW